MGMTLEQGSLKSFRHNSLGLTLVGFFLFASSIQAAVVHYIQDSVNDVDVSAIAAVASDEWLDTAVEYSTVTAPSIYSGYRFVHWTNDSYPAESYRDSWGRSLNPISFVLLEDTIATAHYLPETRDTDTDGVSDWYELEYFGSLTNGASFDGDGDGITLINEQSGGTHPLFGNTNQPGGVFGGDSDLLTVNLAGYSRYTLISDPVGVVNQSDVVSAGTTVTSPDLSANSTFGYWELDGVRQEDVWGVACSQISFIVLSNNVEGVAYLFSGDSDGDSVPDAYEQFYLGTLTNDASSDLDGDGLVLSNEYAEGTHPLYGNSHQDGGVFWADSEMVEVNLAGFSRYTLCSEPVGTVDQSDVVPDGTEITTPSMGQPNFGFWELDGVRQEDEWGVALHQITFTVDGTNREAIAYLFDGDSDGDGVSDGIEYYYYGNLGQAGDSDTDGDGVFLQNDAHPIFGNSHQDGGIFWDDSELTLVNLQFFERVDFVLMDGVLTNFFTVSPLGMDGADLGTNTAPGLGDFDGDGDLDLFVASLNSPLRVYENIGSEYKWDLVDRSEAFVAMGVSGGTPALGDWRGDGNADLAVGFEDGTVRILQSPGTFVDPVFSVDYTISTQASNAVPAFGEVTGDSLLDLIILLGDGTVRVYPNQGGETTPFDQEVFINTWAGITVSGGKGFVMEDITFDGVQDLLASDNDGRIWEFHADGVGDYNLDSKVWGGTYAGFSDRLTLAAGDVDGDGDIDAVVGSSGGGLTYLRDPRIGIPSCLKAYGGAGSVRIIWNPNRNYKLKGYYVYKATSASGPFSRLPAGLISVSTYTDANVIGRATYYYYVTAVSETHIPGSTLPLEVESPPSDIVVATVDSVRLWMPDCNIQTGEEAVVQINVDHGTGVSGAGMDIRVLYDPSVLTPVSQIGTNPTVQLTALTETLDVTNNAAVASGELQITGFGGTVIGDGHMFDLYFQVAGDAETGRTTTNRFSLASLYGNGVSLAVDSSDVAVLTIIVTGYFRGDLSGNGVLNMDDHHHFLWLLKKNTRDPTPEEISAGDMNGNGELDHRDISLLLRLINGH